MNETGGTNKPVNRALPDINSREAQAEAQALTRERVSLWRILLL